jgi:CDP-diacylglycerol--glycerol-3-phosphate 3-phosphatidyltransferase
MFSAQNSLSFIRAPLAFLFLQDNSSLRILAILLAMLTDSIDGYVARRSQSTSKFGAILDPAMDKFFVYFAMVTLFLEDKMTSLEMMAMLSRDACLFLYTTLVIIKGDWKSMTIRSIRWGKITTALQFIVLSGLVLGMTFPWYIFVSFVLMGVMAFFELLQTPTSAAKKL